jgi:coatomer subunit beta
MFLLCFLLFALADDSRERMAACVKVLATPSADSQQVWLDDCRTAFSTLTSDKQSREAAEAAAESAKSYAQPDDLIDFGHLRSRKGGISQLELEDQVGIDRELEKVKYTSRDLLWASRAL